MKLRAKNFSISSWENISKQETISRPFSVVIDSDESFENTGNICNKFHRMNTERKKKKH